MSLTATHSWGKGMCYEGEMHGYRVLVQVMDRASSKGIAGGRITRLHIGKYGTFSIQDSMLTYDREWFQKPPTGADLRDIVEQVVRQIDNKSVDWTAERKQFEASLCDREIRIRKPGGGA